jgi:two-component system sensor histidine kinase YesM
LTIQKIRYRDILDYSVEYEQAMEQKIMLKLLLQPLVENALYHGIKNKRSRGTITIRGWQDENFLRFTIEDDGIGMMEEQLAAVKEQLAADRKQFPETPEFQKPEETRIYGLYNVAKRLELYYNRTDLLDITSVYKEGSRVTLLVPEHAPGEITADSIPMEKEHV